MTYLTYSNIQCEQMFERVQSFSSRGGTITPFTLNRHRSARCGCIESRNSYNLYVQTCTLVRTTHFICTLETSLRASNYAYVWTLFPNIFNLSTFKRITSLCAPSLMFTFARQDIYTNMFVYLDSGGGSTNIIAYTPTPPPLPRPLFYYIRPE